MERQSLLKEIGGKNLQYLIDKTADRFRPILWPNFFTWKNTTSISYETIIGDAANEAAASVVSFDSAAPLRTRKTVRKLTGEIPSIRQKFRMTEKDLQEYVAMTSGISGDAKSVVDLIYKDVKSCSEAPHKRLDLMVLEALSTGLLTLSVTNNPDGMVTEEAIDFGLPAANSETVVVVWSAADKATVKPITDIMAVVEEAAAAGIILDRMLMRRSVFNNLKLADETKDYVTGWKIGANQNQVNLNLATVNAFLEAEGLPRIVIVNASIDVEKD